MYSTTAKVDIIGAKGTVTGRRALVINLDDSNLETTKHDVHMTVIFREDGWPENAISMTSDLIQNWKNSKDINGNIEYYLEPWGKRSDKIKGDLEDLCFYLRDYYRETLEFTDHQRLPHVELR